MGFLTSVRVVRNTGVAASIGAGERNQTARKRVARTGNPKLVASGIELGSGVGPRSMKRNGFMADEVVSRAKAGGDGVLVFVAGPHQRRLGKRLAI